MKEGRNLLHLFDDGRLARLAGSEKEQFDLPHRFLMIILELLVDLLRHLLRVPVAMATPHG